MRGSTCWIVRVWKTKRTFTVRGQKPVPCGHGGDGGGGGGGGGDGSGGGAEAGPRRMRQNGRTCGGTRQHDGEWRRQGK